jgi:RNA polymerase sigma-70 factor (ECF subfamily)
MVSAPSPRLLHSDDSLDAAFVAAVRSVQRYLRFLGCASGELGDLVQEVMLAGLARFPGGEAPVPWLFGTAKNLFRRHLRDRRRRAAIADLEHFDRLWTEQARDGTGDAARDALRRCLEQLPERSRAVLELRYGEELERAAIARRTGLGEEGVKSLLVRTRTVLADCVRRRMDRE